MLRVLAVLQGLMWLEGFLCGTYVWLKFQEAEE